LVLVRGHHARLFEALALSIGLYGSAGLLCAALLGWAAATALGAIPGGWGALREDEDLDARTAGCSSAACCRQRGPGGGRRPRLRRIRFEYE
jgi:hypothetical protein